MILRNRLIIISIILMSAVSVGYGITVSFSGNDAHGSSVYSELFNVNSNEQITSALSGSILSQSFSGSGSKSTTFSVTNNFGDHADVGFNILNSKSYSGSYTLSPKSANYAQATETLNVDTASSIYAFANAKSRNGYNAHSDISVTRGSLVGYKNSAYADATQATTSENADSASAISTPANSVKISGTSKDNSGTYSINTALKGITGGTASFQGLSETSSAGTTSQVAQTEHLHGTFTSTATYTPKTGIAKTKTRTSDYGTDYDLNMMAAKGSSPTGIIGYYVDSATNANKIQGAVNAAQSGDTINVAAGTYAEDVNINKGLTLKGTGDPTADSFTLSAPLGFGSGGITAPTVNVNSGGRIQDGVTLSSQNVNVGPGYYKENVVVGKSLTIKGSGSSFTGVDGNGAGSVFYIAPSATVALSDMTIRNGKADYGGGINNDGSLTVSGCTISGNTASGNTASIGGGIYNSGTATITSSSIFGNTAGTGGGGIYNSGTATVTSSSIFGNTAAYSGGGIFNGGTATIQGGSSIFGNTAYGGGGIATSGTATIQGGSSIFGNTAAIGGGMFIGGTATIQGGSSIFGNTAAIGGGICVISGLSHIIVDPSKVHDNTPNDIGTI